MNVPSITISASPSNPIDSGALVSFIVATQFPGANPIYAWTKNGTPVGSNIPGFSDSDLGDGDVISCTLTSDYPCTFPTTFTSEPFKIKQMPGGHLLHDGICLGAHLSFIPSSMFSQVDWLR